MEPAPDARITDADLALLLAERDREDPLLAPAAPREPEPEPAEALDSQILAALISP
jgi:hypothetical protein